MAIFAIRIICPIIILFGIYLIANGHITSGGGFQGGLAVASFFICRYMVYNIYDMPVSKVIKVEKLVFTITVLLAMFAIFLGAMYHLYHPVFQNIYLVAMNMLIGMKVACAFFILFYRYIAIERR
jgi:multicomponent Na+:H+ antiporter subunit B